MAPRPQTSAAGVLALLSEPESVLRQHALRSLNTLIPQFWAEISEYITTMYVIDVNLLLLNRADKKFTIEKRCMRAMTYQRTRVTLLL
jgi:hypothetical protein